MVALNAELQVPPYKTLANQTKTTKHAGALFFSFEFLLNFHSSFKMQINFYFCHPLSMAEEIPISLCWSITEILICTLTVLPTTTQEGKLRTSSGFLPSPSLLHSETRTVSDTGLISTCM